MPIPIHGPLCSNVPLRTIERDELRRRVIALGDWEFRTKHILVGYAVQPDGPLEVITNATIPYNCRRG
jgi:hypothetical protein